MDHSSISYVKRSSKSPVLHELPFLSSIVRCQKVDNVLNLHGKLDKWIYMYDSWVNTTWKVLKFRFQHVPPQTSCSWHLGVQGGWWSRWPFGKHMRSDWHLKRVHQMGQSFFLTPSCLFKPIYSMRTERCSWFWLRLIVVILPLLSASRFGWHILISGQLDHLLMHVWPKSFRCLNNIQ